MKLKKVIKYSTQNIDSNDIKSVVKTLKSDYITEGPIVRKFEKVLCNFAKSKNATVVNSASTALIIACSALNLSNKDILWTTPITFVSSANCAFYFNAKVDFVDIDHDTFNLDVDKLEKKLISAKKKNKLPKILVIVHLGGSPCNLKKIRQLSKKYNFYIIEDASHALGAKYQKINIGNSIFSDITIFSFHPVKSITTGEGGALLTNNKQLHEKIQILRSNGIIKDRKKLTISNKPAWYYEQKFLSSNFKMNAIQAALGVSQMKRLKKFINKRNLIASKYEKKLPNKNLKFQKILKNTLSSRHLFIIYIDNNLRDKLYNFLKKNKIQTNLHYIPIYRHPYYKRFNINKKNFLNAEEYYSKALSLPIHFNLSNQEQNYIISKIKLFFQKKY